MSRLFLGVLRQDEMSRAIGTDDLVFVADAKVHCGMAERAGAAVTTDDAVFNDNRRLQMHDGCPPVKSGSKKTVTKPLARTCPGKTTAIEQRLRCHDQLPHNMP